MSLDLENRYIETILWEVAPWTVIGDLQDIRPLREDAPEEIRLMYKEVFYPYLMEHRRCFWASHGAGEFLPWEWYGNESFDAMTRALNVKARVILYYQVIEESLKRYFPGEMQVQESSYSAHRILMRAVLDITEGMPVGVAVTQAVKILFGKKEEMLEEMVAEIESGIKKLDAEKDRPFFCR